LELTEQPHRRLNPLTQEWILVSPHRALRPWQGEVAKRTEATGPQYDPTCYLCPGNPRAGGVHNPKYEGTFVFDNDFAALLPKVPHQRLDVKNRGLLVAEGESGLCRVICFSPKHDLTLSTMTAEEIEPVVRTWKEQFTDLGAMPGINHVQIFENRGAMMGASNPHPHCQIWATYSIPEIPAKEVASQKEYLEKNGKCLLCRYTKLELEQSVRLIYSNEAFVAMVPFWAVWPFEILVCSRRHIGTFEEFDPAEISGLSQILRRVTATYDKVFDTPFPYSMGFHQSPTDGQEHPGCHFHAHFFPPLLRSATIRKFMVGFEMLGMPQRDITPESAAERLKALAEL
jgi:UDPglucose--hexose-1-phosphate uridylyltransferase